MTPRHSIAAVLALACVILLAGCSGSGTPSAPAADIVQAIATEAPPAPTPTEGPHVPTVVLDPGHGGDEVGASNYGVVEKHSNLDMAFRIERLLQDEGVRVVLTRREDARVATRPGLGSTFGSTRFDLQARIDIANSAEADVFLALHSNGSPSGDQSGVEVWFDPNREFGEQNRTLAQTIQDNVLRELAVYGYGAVDRGIKDDTCFRQRSGRCFPLFVLGPPRTTTREELLRRGVNPDILGLEPGQQAITTRATNMPGALVELLFISNAADAAMLADEGARDAMARAVTDALLSMLPPTQ
jgi:N-acetylmuramoyl-L-alanine amidase